MAAKRLTQEQASSKLKSLGWKLLSEYVDFYTAVKAKHLCGLVVEKGFGGFNERCSCNKVSNAEKARLSSQAYFEKTGFHNPGQNPEVQAKMRETNLRRMGVPNPMQSEATKLKSIKTLRRKYGSHVTNVMDVPDIRVKSTAWMNCPKRLRTKAENCKNTCIKKYGTQFYFQTADFKKKAEAKWMKSHGVRNPMQVRDVHEQAMKTGFRTFDYITKSGRTLKLQGAEPLVASKLEDNGYRVRVSKFSIGYRLDGKSRVYHPDLDCKTTRNQLVVVEVKSTYTLIRDLDTNLAKFRAANRFARNNSLIFALVVSKGDGRFQSIAFPTKRKLTNLIGHTERNQP